jgi:hypothetical protein
MEVASALGLVFWVVKRSARHQHGKRRSRARCEVPGCGWFEPASVADGARRVVIYGSSLSAWPRGPGAPAPYERSKRPGPAVAKRRLDPDRARFGSRLPWLPAMTVSGEPHPLGSRATVVSGRARLAGSDADRVFCTGADCRGASDYVRCVLLVVR